MPKVAVAEIDRVAEKALRNLGHNAVDARIIKEILLFGTPRRSGATAVGLLTR